MHTALLLSADEFPSHSSLHAFFFVEAKLCSVNHGRPGVCGKRRVASNHVHADFACKGVDCCEGRIRDGPRALHTVANGGKRLDSELWLLIFNFIICDFIVCTAQKVSLLFRVGNALDTHQRTRHLFLSPGS